MARNKLRNLLLLIASFGALCLLPAQAQDFSPAVPQDKTCTGTDVFTAYVAGKFTCTTFSGGGITTLNTLTDTTQTLSVTNDTNVTGSWSSVSPNHALVLGWAGTAAAGRLNSNVVQAISNDTNITGSISAQNLTLGFTGTLAKARTLGTTVYTDQVNTFSVGGQEIDASANNTTLLKMKRFTDTSPTGSYLLFRNAADTSTLFGVSTIGAITGTNVNLTSTSSSNLLFVSTNVAAGLDLVISDAANSGANQSSPTLEFDARYFNGSSSVTDAWTIRNALSSGTTPTSTLTFARIPGGSSGAGSVNGPIFDATTGFRVNGSSLNFSHLAGTVTAAQMPNPSATTLGGIESLASSASKWINTISTSGVPSATQPAFTDISGSVAATQLPNPSATTIGGIESLAATSHQWIDTISTSGVPSSTQPAFSDVSGTAGLAQGGTNADLSATGGTSQVLKQTGVGSAVTVARLACSDLSNAATSCSTDTTSASNVTSGTLPIAQGGTGSTAGSYYPFVFGQTTVLTCSNGGGTAVFNGIANTTNATETSVLRATAPAAGKLKFLAVKMSANVPASQTVKVEISKNASVTSQPTCSITAGNSSCVDTSTNPAISANDLLAAKITCSGGTTATTGTISITVMASQT